MPIVTPDYSKLWEGYSKEGQAVEDTAPTPSASTLAAPAEPARAPAALPEPESKDGRLGASDLERMFGPSAPKATGAMVDLEHPSAVKKPAIIPAKAPTRFVQSGTSAAPTQERTLGSALSEAGENFFPSVGEALKATGHALNPANWGETLGNLKGLAQGAVSKATGMKAGQTPEEQAHNEAMVNGLVEHYKNVYATSPQKFYEALAKDPASIMMDMSMLLTGGETAAAKLGASAETAAKIGKAAQWIDPVTGTVKAATTGIKGLTAPLRATAAGTSGLSMDMQKIIRDAATTSNPELREAYNKFASGKGDSVEFLQAAKDAIDKLSEESFNEFKNSKSSIAGKNINFSKIDSDIQSFRNELNKGSVHGFPEAKAALDEADNMVLDLMHDPSRQSLEHVDQLKRQIYNLHKKYTNTEASTYIDKVYHSISDTLSNPALGGAKEYKDIMDKSKYSMSYINDAERFLAAGNKSAATNSLMKALKNTKGYNAKTMMEDISRIDPTIKYMLAGVASSPAYDKSILRNISDLAIFGTLGTLVHPAAYAGIATASPRIVAGANYYGAKGAGLAEKAAKPAYGLGRLDEIGGQQELPPSVSPQDVDAMVRTVIGEAGGEPPEGQAAVAHVIMNRLNKGGFGGENIKDVVTAPHQFEAVSRGVADKIDPNSKQYQEVLNNIVLPLLRGELQDVTGGATNFINKDLQSQRGMQIPEWAAGEGQKIGRHTFYGTEGHADGGRIERASGGKVGKSIGQLTDRLMKMAKDAKKVSDKRTEPLLNAPDEAIVKALDVAQQAI